MYFSRMIDLRSPFQVAIARVFPDFFDSRQGSLSPALLRHLRQAPRARSAGKARWSLTNINGQQVLFTCPLIISNKKTGQGNRSFRSQTAGQ